ncbi:hypothetical protein RhiirA5_443264 [Rhizophagus irregularis]|uniref:Uncharacterized protein n=1 Tax=Rhizophagus irregularis TaxID=588596 RepID=A0A2N0NE16_9GLOM|nr:hypothetical protein RhiirA5_443264 [Rhizophagus irregularis]
MQDTITHHDYRISELELMMNYDNNNSDVSHDASFSTLDPNSVLSKRHVPLPNSRHTIIAPDANASRLQLEISNVTNTQKNLSLNWFDYG